MEPESPPASHLPHLDLLGQNFCSLWLSRRVEMCYSLPQKYCFYSRVEVAVGTTSARGTREIVDQFLQKTFQPISPAVKP